LPPDYTNQRETAVSNENRRRQQTASQYNDRVNFFNQQLSGFGSNIDTLGDTIRGMDIASDWSNYDTLRSQIDDYQDRLNDFVVGDFSSWTPWTPPEPDPSSTPTPNFTVPDFSGFDFSGLGSEFGRGFGARGGSLNFDFSPATPRISAGATRNGLSAPVNGTGNNQANLQYDEFGFPIAPNWSNTGTAYGESVFYDTPTLQGLDTARAQSWLQELSDFENSLTGLYRDRENELRRGRDFYSDFVNRANMGDIEVEYAGLDSEFERYLAEIARARSEIDQFNSVLGFDSERQAALDEIAAFEELVRSRMGARDTERGRIDDFRTDVAGQANALRNRLRGLGIESVGDPASIYSEIDALYDQLSGFDSEISTDFGDLRAVLGDAEYMFSDLRAQRAAEEARLNQLRSQFGGRAATFDRQAGRFDIYDGYALDDLEDQIAMFEQELGGVTSPLGFDTSAFLGDLTSARSQLADVRSRREAALASELGDVDALLATLPDLAEYDEGGLNALRSRLQREVEDLQRYGGGTTENLIAIDDAMRQVDERMEQLNASRRGIEGDALALMQQIRNGEFRNMDEVTAFEDPFEELRNRAELFRATSAQDELDVISQLLGDGKSLVQGFEDDVATAEGAAAARTRALLDANNNLRFPIVAGQRLQTEEQLRSFLAALGVDDEEAFGRTNASAFSRGVIGG
jgi:hypothetical protein